MPSTILTDEYTTNAPNLQPSCFFADAAANFSEIKKHLGLAKEKCGFIWVFGFCFPQNKENLSNFVGLYILRLDFFAPLVYAYAEKLWGGESSCWQQKDAD